MVRRASLGTTEQTHHFTNGLYGSTILLLDAVFVVWRTDRACVQDDIAAFVTEEQKDALVAELSAASTWMDDEADITTGTQEYKDKLTALNKSSREMFWRIKLAQVC